MKMRQRRRLSSLLLAALAVVALAATALAGATPRALADPTPPTMSESHWLYFGMPGDGHKSLAFVGGELAADGSKTPIQYWMSSGSTTYYPNETIWDLRDETSWSLDDGYLPSPISSWPAGAATISVQHFAYCVSTCVPGTSATAVYTRVTVTNPSASTYTGTLNISALPTTELPLTSAPATTGTSSMTYNVSVPVNGSENFDFVTLASGSATSAQLLANGTFNANLALMTSYWNTKLAGVALPTSLPDPQLITMYKAEQIILWEVQVKDSNGDLEERGSGGNITSGIDDYNGLYNHDVPDIVSTFIRGGDYASAKAILSSSYYQKFGTTLPPTTDYLDTITKWLQPFDLYAQDANDPGFFTSSLQDTIETVAHEIPGLEETAAGDPHDGLMEKSNTMDNGSDYLIVDDFSALYGLQAYANLATRWGWTTEASWAKTTAGSIDTALNSYLTSTTLPRLSGYYNSCLDACGMDNNGYSGNTIGSSLMDSALPWDGYLAGNTNLGTWATDLDNSVLTSWQARADQTSRVYPPHDWGAWQGESTGYGSTYNAANGVQLLESSNPNLRTEAVSDLEFLLANQSAPMEWGESYSAGSWSTPLADLESWGSSGIVKTILETDVSVASDGSLILGRGIPTSWLESDRAIAWSNVPIGGGQARDITITPSNGGTTVTVTLSSAVSSTVKVELPDFIDNTIASTSAGTINQANGEVDLPAGTTSATITLSTLNAAPIVVDTAENHGYTFGSLPANTQTIRSQTFLATSAPDVTGVQVAIRQYAGETGQSDATVKLFAVTPGGIPTGNPLASATIPASEITQSFQTFKVALSYDGLVDGQPYAIEMSQVTPGSSVYEWATSGSDPVYDQYHYGTTWIKDTIGDAALTVDVSGNDDMAASTAGTITSHYAFGKVTNQVQREQAFLDTGITSLSDVRVTVRDAAGSGTGQSAMTVSLYNVAPGGSYTGAPLATTTVPASEIHTSDTTIDVPLSYSGLVPGQQYAILLGQVTPSNTSWYEWSTVGTDGPYGFGQIQANGVWVREPDLGQGWLQVDGTLR